MRKSLRNFGEKIRAFSLAGRRRLDRPRMTPPCPAKCGKNAIRNCPWRARESQKSGDRITSKTAFSSPLEFQVARGKVRYCMIRCAVLGVLLVGCKIFPSGISLERPTRQKPTEPTTKLVAILQRHLLLPLEILVDSDSHVRQPDRAGSPTKPTVGQSRPTGQSRQPDRVAEPRACCNRPPSRQPPAPAEAAGSQAHTSQNCVLAHT